LLTVVAWFVVTSESFLKAVVLPRVGTSIHGNLTAESIALNPFSRLQLKGARLTDTEGKELLAIGGLSVRFKLFKLLDGVIALDQLQIVEPKITIEADADGASNLSKWIAEFAAPADAKPTCSSPGKALQLDLGRIDISKGHFEFVRRDPVNKDMRAVAGKLDLSIDQLRNGQTSEGVLKLSLLMEQWGTNSVVEDSLSATFEVSSNVALDADLVPGAIELELNGAVDKVLGRFKESSGASVKMTIASAGSKIENVTVAFSRDGHEVGRVEAAGEYEIDDGVGEFDLTVKQLPPLVQDLVSIALAMDFDLGSLGSTNHIVLRGLNKPISAQGSLQLGQLTVRNSTGSTPRVDLGLEYDFYLDLENSRGRFDRVNLAVNEDGQARAAASITEPFSFAWVESLGSAQGSKLELSLSDVSLDEWQALTGKLPVNGLLNLNAAIQSQQEGQMLVVNGRTSLRQASIERGTNVFTNVEADLVLEGQLDRFHLLSLRSLDFKISQSNRPPASVRGSGTMNFTNLVTDVQVALNFPLTNMVSEVSGFPEMLGSGLASYNGLVVYTNGSLIIDGKLDGSNLDLSVVEKAFGKTTLQVPLSAQLVNQQLKWSIVDASIHPAAGEVLPFSSSGDLGLDNLAGTLSLSIPRIGNDLMNGYLTNHLDGGRLKSGLLKVAVNGDLLADGRQKWSAVIQSTNMVIVDGDNEPIGPAFSDHLDLETLIHWGKSDYALTTCLGTLFADGQACGRLDATGRILVNAREAKLNIQIWDLDENALRPFASRVIGDRQLEKVNVVADFDLDYHPDRKSGLKASLSVNDLLIREPSGQTALDRQYLEFLFDTQIVSNRLDITQGQLRLAPTTNASNVIDLAGWINFEDPKAIEGDVALRSQGFDLTATYDLLSRPPAEVAPRSSLHSEGKKLAGLEAEWRATVLPFKHLGLSLDFRKLFLRELVASNWVARAVVRTNSFEISPFSLSLNGAPVNLATTLRSLPDSSEFDLALEIEGVELSPVIRTFDPGWDHLARAEFYGAADLHGRVAHNSSIWSSTTGHVYAGLTNAHAELLSREWQHLLQPVGLLLQTPVLFSSPINWFYSHTELGDEQLKLHQYTIMSDAYVADVHTTIALNTNFVDSVFPNVPIELYLSRNLVTRHGGSANQTEYVGLPEFLYLQGTFKEPKVMIDKLKTSKMVLGKAGNFVGGTAGGLLKGAGNVTEGIGGLLSGKTFVDPNTKLGPVSHGIDFLFHSVGGILGQTGGAVETGTGAVTGTEVLSGDIIAQRFQSFDWPRQFTNAPNAVATGSK